MWGVICLSVESEEQLDLSFQGHSWGSLWSALGHLVGILCCLEVTGIVDLELGLDLRWHHV